METILLTISTVIFLSSAIIIAIKYGVQKSISESYYRLPNKQKALFTLALWGFSIPMIIVGGSIGSIFLFLAGGLIALVGAAPAFKGLLMEYRAHMFGAYGGILLGLIALLTFGMWELVVIAAVVSIVTKLTVKNYIWWIEIIAFITIVLGTFIHVIN